MREGQGIGRKFLFEALTGLDGPRAILLELERVELRLAIEQMVEKVRGTVGPVERVSAKADPHVTFGAGSGYLLVDSPPWLGKKGRLVVFREIPRGVVVRVINLNAADALFVEGIELGDEAVGVQVITSPPPKRDFAVAWGRFLKTGEHIEPRFPGGQARAASPGRERQEEQGEGQRPFFHGIRIERPVVDNGE